MSVKEFPTIESIRTFIVDGAGSGGDYHNVEGGHWFVPPPRYSVLALWWVCL